MNSSLGDAPIPPPPPVNRDLLPADLSREESLREIKARFLSEAKKIDVLEPLRKHPFATVGSAAILGAVAGVVTSALAKPKVVVYHEDENKQSEKKQDHPKGKAVSIISMIQPLLLKAGSSLASAWLARRQAANNYSTSGVDAYE